MAKVFLGENESYSIINNSEVFGNIGSEELFISGSNVKVMSTVERIDFPNNLDTYSFGITGNVLTVKSGAATIATIVIPDTANGQTLAFADGSAQLIITGLNQATLGGVAIGTVPGSIDAPLNGEDTSGVQTGNVFTLTENVLSETTADILTTIDPVITYETYWGFNPHSHGETGVDNLAGGNTNNLTNEGPQDGGVPLKDLVKYIQDIANLDFVELGLINVSNDLPNDTTQFPDLSDLENVELEANADGTGTATITVTLTDGTVNTAEVALGEMYFKLIHDLLYDAEGNSRLYQVETKTWPRVVLKDQNGDPVLDADGKAITVNLYEYVAEGITTTTQIPIVLTPTANNGGTEETGFTNDGNDLIVVARLNLLHQAYIDGGEGYNTLEIDAKGYYAQPKALLNIQEIHVENLPNVYTEIIDGVAVSLYPDLASVSGSDSGVLNSIVDISRAVDLERLVITEGSFEGMSDVLGHVAQPGTLTVAGIRNGAVARIEGGFTQDVTLHYSEGQTGPLTVELLLGQIAANLNFVHNNDSLHLVSLGGAANSFGSEDIDGSGYGGVLGGRLTNLYISGDAALYINGDLDDSFQDDTPILIDASENTGGVDLELSESQNVTFIGSLGNDDFTVITNGFDNDESVTITGGPGNNHYYVETYTADITNADGDNDYEVYAWDTSIESGDGNNEFEVFSAVVDLTVGDGDNRIDVTTEHADQEWNIGDTTERDSIVTIDAGNGANEIKVWQYDEGYNDSNVTINAGDGSNIIDVYTERVTINTGAGKDVISAYGAEITINSGAGDDVITVGGRSTDYGPSDFCDAGSLIKIDTGAGSAVINLGNTEYNEISEDTFPFQNGPADILALEGSSITGTNIKLFVNTVADLRAATLSGITKVVLDDDRYNLSDAPQANDGSVSSNAMLTLTASQFKAIGGANFSVDGSIFNTHAFVKIICDLDAAGADHKITLAELGVDNLPRNIDLFLEINDGVTLEMTAQQLHERVAASGVTIAPDGNTDLVSGKVLITGAASFTDPETGVKSTFDPFNTNDATRPGFGDVTYIGGSLSTDFLDAGQWVNVDVKYKFAGGYIRPMDSAAESVITIDTTNADEQSIGAQETWLSNLEIIGNHDVTFTGAINLGEDFIVDFSQLNGNVVNLTLADFQDVELIRGNGNHEVPATVYVQMKATLDNPSTTNVNEAEDAIIGSLRNDGGTPTDTTDDEYNGLVSSGVQRYIVTDINDGDTSSYDPESATIYLCDSSQDVEVVGLRGNYNATLNVLQVPWQVSFELQGDGVVNYSTLKSSGPTATSNVGVLHAEYQWEGAPAVVNINNQGVALTTRSLYSAGIDIDNASSITVNVANGNAIIESVTGDDVCDMTFTSAKNISIIDAISIANLDTMTASGVLGDFAATLTGDAPDSGFDFIASKGVTTLTLDGDATLGFHSSLTADSAATFTIVIAAGTEGDGVDINTVDLSAATLTNVDKIVLNDNSEVSLTQSQVAAIEAADIVLAHPGIEGAVNIVNVGSSVFDSTDIGAGVTVNVTLQEGVTTLDPNTDLSNVNSFSMPEGAEVTMSADQLIQLAESFAANGQVLGTANDSNTVNITGLTQEHLDWTVEYAGTEYSFRDMLEALAGEVGAGTITIVDDVILYGSTLHAAALGGIDGFTLIGAADDLRVDVIMDQDTVGANAEQGIKSTGIATYVVTDFIDEDGNHATDQDAEIFVCNSTQDLEVLGIQGNDTNRITFTGVKWGVEFLMEGDGAAAWTEVEKIQNEFDGDWNQSNIGSLYANFYTDGAPAVVNINNQGVALGAASTGGSRILDVDGIDIDNANSLVINIANGNATIGFVKGDSIDSLDINSANNVAITRALDANAIESIDTAGVAGTFSATLAGSVDDAFTFISGPGATTLTLADTFEVNGQTTINGTAGPLTLVLTDVGTPGSQGDGDPVPATPGDVDLSPATLTGVDAIVYKDVNANAANTVELTLTAAQVDAIGLSHITVADNDEDTIILNIVKMDNTPIILSNLTDNVEIGTVTMAAGTWTLAPTTVLTDAVLQVPTDGVLTLTADQFMALEDLDGLDSDLADYATIHITGLTQAHVDAGFTLAGVSNAKGTVELAPGVDGVILGTFNENFLVDTSVDLNGFAVVLSDDQTLTLVNMDQADGLDVSGGSNTTLVLYFTDGFENPYDTFDASGWDIDTVKMPNELVAGRDIELFQDMSSDICVKIYAIEHLGVVLPIDRCVTVEEGVTVDGFLVLNDYQGDSSVVTLNLNLNGGAVIDGNVRLTTVVALDEEGYPLPDPADENGNPLTQNFFDTLTINSIMGVDDPNHNKFNVINGDIDPTVRTTNEIDNHVTAENNLLEVIINASAPLTITGDIVFNSVDEIEDHSAAIDPAGISLDKATLVVNGTAAVTLGGIDTTDADLDSVTITNNSSAALTLNLDTDADAILDNDGALILVGGTAGINLVIVEDYATAHPAAATVDLSAATLSGINSVKLVDATLTLTADQLIDIGQANLIAADGADAGSQASGTLHIVNYSGQPIDIAALEDADINVVSITVAASATPITITGDLTGVDALIIPDGTTVNITAAQFMQLTNGTVTRLDDSDPDTAPGTLNITDLGNDSTITVDFINYGVSTINVSNVDPDLQGTISLLATEDAVIFKSTAVLEGFDILMTADGQSVTFSNHDQADGRVVTEGAGVDNTAIVIGYDNNLTPINATDYGTDQIYVYNTLVADQNVEALLFDLDQTVEVVIFKYDPRVDPGAIEQVNRVVTILPDVTVDGELIFNDVRPDVEVVSLTLNMSGGSTIEGDLRLPETDPDTYLEDNNKVASYFDVLTINSTGDGQNEINGVINAADTDGSGTEIENNLLQVNINADEALYIEGIDFSSMDQNNNLPNSTDPDLDEATATLNVENSAAVVIDDLDTNDEAVDHLVINHTGSGSLTVGLSSVTTIDPTDTITFNGSVDANDTIVISGEIDLSDDTLVSVDNIELNEAATVWLTTTQLLDIGLANITSNDSTTAPTEYLVITDYNGEAIDFSDLQPGIVVAQIILLDTDSTLTINSLDLTNVAEIVVPEGVTLNITAAKFQELIGAGTISGDGIVNITDLTQADVDAMPGGLNLSGITAGQGTITLLDNTVVLRAGNTPIDTDGDGDIDIPAHAVTNIDGFGIDLAAGQMIVLSNYAQANGRDITGDSNSIARIGFTAYTAPIDVDGYAVPQVDVLHNLIENADAIDNNVEVLLTGLASSATLHVIHIDDIEDYDYAAVTVTNRVVVIEEGVRIADDVIFTDLRPGHEIANLTITMQGDAGIGSPDNSWDGDLDITAISNHGTLVDPATGLNWDPNYFKKLTLISEGTEANAIEGEITAGHWTWQNNLTDIEIQAHQDLTIGEIHFQARDENDNATAHLTVDTDLNADVVIGDLRTEDEEVDALHVVHTGEGSLEIRLDGWDLDADDVITIDGSAAGQDTLVISDEVDLSDNGDSISDIDMIKIETGAVLTLTLDQYNDVAPENIYDAPSGKLNIIGLDDTEFDATIVAGNGVDMFEVTMIDADVELHEDTDLTDVDFIYVHSGRTLTLTAAQFQQLADAGAIQGVGGATDFTVNITDLTQADVDAVGGLDLSGITGNQGTITLLDNTVILRGVHANEIADNPFTVENEATPERFMTVLDEFAIVVGAGQQITLSNEAQADGRTITGGGTVWLGFAGIADNEINCANYDIAKLEVWDALIEGDNYNVEDLLQGLISSVEVHVFDVNANVPTPIDPASVTKTLRVFVIDENTTLTEPEVVFANLNAGSEVSQLTIVLDGNATIEGNINLGAINHGIIPGSVTPETPAGIEYAPDFFQKLVITSQGDTANEIDGVISGLGGVDINVNPTPGEPQIGLENNLLDVTINADQTLQLDGITFTSITDGATADLLVRGDFATTIDDLTTGDDEVDALEVTHEAGSTGDLTIGLSTLATIDEGADPDDITITGSTAAIDTLILESDATTPMDLSDDELFSINSIVLVDESVLTLSQTQINDLDDLTGGLSDIVVANSGDTATLHVVDVMGTGFPFDASQASAGVNIASITIIDDPTVTLDPATDLTGVDEIIVLAGTTLNLTAAQFLQLEGNSVTGDTISGGGTVNITDLYQVNVGDGDDLDFSTITANQGTITLHENVVLDPLTDLSNFAIELANGQVIGLSSEAQADGREITGTGATSTVQLGFDILTGMLPQIDCGNYDISDLWVLDRLVELYSQNNVEWILDDLASETLVTIFDMDATSNPPVDVDADSLKTHREVLVQPDVTVDSNIGFNDLSPYAEVADLTLTLSGNSIIDGNLNLFTTPDALGVNGTSFEYLQWVQINSTGDADNAIDGFITGTPVALPPNILQNNVLDVRIDATVDADLTIGGIEFSARNQAERFVLDLNDAMNVLGDDTITFDGVTVNLSAVDTATQAAAAIITQYNAAPGTHNWTAAAYFGDSTRVVFTYDIPGINVSPVVSTDFVFYDDLGAGVEVASPNFDGEVTITNEGGFNNETAELLVTGAGDVTINDLNIDDDEVDGLIVDHNGSDNVSASDDPTGVLNLSIDGNNIDDEDDIAIYGSENADDNLHIYNTVDLSDDILVSIDHIKLDPSAVLTLNLSQFIDIGGLNITDAPPAELYINGVDGRFFDVTTVALPIDVVDLTLVDADVNLATNNSNLTDVDRILVYEGRTLTMTATQFAQLLDGGSIEGVGGTTDFTVIITGLTQEIVDAGFDLTGILTSNRGTITLAENLTLDPDDTLLAGFGFELTNGQQLVLSNQEQADGRYISGPDAPGQTSTVVLGFDTLGTPDTILDTENYDISDLYVLDKLIENYNYSNVETLLDELASHVVVTIFEANGSNVEGLDVGLDYTSIKTSREVVVAANTTVSSSPMGDSLVFNDLSNIAEVSDLTLTLSGNSILNGDIRLSTVQDDLGPDGTTFAFLQWVEINSIGTKPNEINGVLTGNTNFGYPLQENNMLDVTINAPDVAAPLSMDGIEFTSRGQTELFVLELNPAMAANAGDTIAFDGQTLTLPGGVSTAAEVAAYIAANFSSTSWDAVPYFGFDTRVLFVSKDPGVDVPDVQPGDIVFTDVFSDGLHADSFNFNGVVTKTNPGGGNDATAELTVTGAATVTIDGLDTSDVQVTGLNVFHNGVDPLLGTDDPTGTLNLTIDGADINADDDLAIYGSVNAKDNLFISNTVDLSDDILESVDSIKINNDAILTLNLDQFLAVTAADGIDDDPGVLHIVDVDQRFFDVTANVEAGINVVDLTLVPTSEDANVVLNPLTVLTGVDRILVNEGQILTMTAEQFAQLENDINGDDVIDSFGRIEGVGGTTNFAVRITGLTQDIVDGDTVYGDAGFNLTHVTGTAGYLDANGKLQPLSYITLGENIVVLDPITTELDSKELTTPDPLGSLTNKFAINLTEGQTIVLSNQDQADGRVINSSAGTAVENNVNLMLVLDNSESMDQIIGGITRLQAMKNAVNAMLDDVAGIADHVAVRVVVFSPGDSSFGAAADAWLSVADAKTVVNSLNAGGYTDFNDALTAAMAAFAVGQGTIFNTDGTSQVMLITDGVALDPVSATVQQDWEDFLDANEMLSNAIAFGPDALTLPLEPVAYDGSQTPPVQIPPVPAVDGDDLLDVLSGLGSDIITTSKTTVILGFDTLGVRDPLGNPIGEPGADDPSDHFFNNVAGTNPETSLDTSNYDVSDLWVYDKLVENYNNNNIEVLLDELDETVDVTIFEYDPNDPTSSNVPVSLNEGALSHYRHVIIDKNTTVESKIVFNDNDPGQEVSSLTLDLTGGSVVEGVINLRSKNEGAYTQNYLQSVEINSDGTNANELQGVLKAGEDGNVTTENNLLDVTINAIGDGGLSLQGIVFTSRLETETFVLTLDPATKVVGNDTFTFRGITLDLGAVLPALRIANPTATDAQLVAMAIDASGLWDTDFSDNTVSFYGMYPGQDETDVVYSDFIFTDVFDGGSIVAPPPPYVPGGAYSPDGSILGGSVVITNQGGGEGAHAQLLVTGTEDVAIGDLTTGDDQVDFLDITHTGSGMLTVGLSTLATIDEDDLATPLVDEADVITFTGSATATDILTLSSSAAKPMDLSDDTLISVDRIILNEGAVLTLDTDQLIAITEAEVIGTSSGAFEQLTLNDYNGQAINTAALLTTGVVVSQLILRATATPIVIAGGVDLSNVMQIVVPDGTTLNLTAAQLQQLPAGALIVPQGPLNTGIVNVTGLTQADVNAVGGLDLSGIDPDIAGSLTLAGSVLLNPTDDLGAFDLQLGTFDIGLSDDSQAGYGLLPDGRTIVGGAGSSVTLGFDVIGVNNADADWTLNAKNWTFPDLFVLDRLVELESHYIEDLFINLASGPAMHVHIFQIDPADPTSTSIPVPVGINSAALFTNRLVTVEADTTLDAGLAFADLDGVVEVVTVALNLGGNAVVTGNIDLSAHAESSTDMFNYLQSFTIASNGAGPNRIAALGPENGDISALGGVIPPGDSVPTEENNLRVVNISTAAAAPLTIDGDIFFTSRNETETFTLTLDPDMQIVDADTITFGTKTINLADGMNAAAVNAAIAAQIAVPQFETIVLDLNDAMLVNGLDTVTFAGTTVAFVGGEDAFAAALAIGWAVLLDPANPWHPTGPVGAGGVLTLERDVAGDITDVLIGDFVFADVAPASTSFLTGNTVTTTIQGYAPAWSATPTAVAPKAEKFVLDLANTLAVVGDDTVTFDGTVITLADGDTQITAAAAIALAVNADALNSWSAVANGDGTVSFTNDGTGLVSDITIADFVFADVGGASTALTGAVTLTQEGGLTQVLNFTSLNPGVNVTDIVSGAFVFNDFDNTEVWPAAVVDGTSTDFTGAITITNQGGGANYNTAQLNITAAGDVTLGGIDVTDTDITGLTVAYSGAGDLTILSVTDTLGDTITLTSTGTTGNVYFNGAAAVGTLNLTGGTGADTLISGTGIDTINGGSGADIIIGGDGGDIINGGAGVNLYDMFYASGGGTDSDIISGSAPAAGFDVVTCSVGDMFGLFGPWGDITVVEAAMVAGAANPATTSGNDLATALNAAFVANTDGLFNVEAMLIQFVNGDKYFVVDGGSGTIGTDNDIVVKIVGAATGLTLNADFHAVLA